MREMLHGTRHEALNDVFGAINWCKTRSMGTQLAHALNDAVFMFAKQKVNFNDLKQTFSDDVVEQWETMIKEWEDDKSKSKPNPYEELVIETSVTEIRLRLAKEEAQLQEQQQVLLNTDSSTDSDTIRKKANLQEKRNALQHCIRLWRRVQAIYMPIVTTLLLPDMDLMPMLRPIDAASALATGMPRPEREKLWMPSDLSASQHETGVVAGLISKELRLHEAEVEDALHNIRWLIWTHMGLRHYKKKHVDGPSQKCHTCARTIISRLMQKQDRQFEHYRSARQALEALCSDEHASWQTRLPHLRKADLVDPSGHDDQDDDPSKMRKQVLEEGRREVLIIWRVFSHNARDLLQTQQSQDNGDDVPLEEVHKSMCITYARSQAHVRCWKEEIQMLLEEMRHVITTLQKRAGIWKSWADARPDVPKHIQSGLHAYAIRQEHINIGMASAFKERWMPLIVKYGLCIDWPEPVTPTDISVEILEDVVDPNVPSAINADLHPNSDDDLLSQDGSSSSDTENGENEELGSDFEAVDS